MERLNKQSVAPCRIDISRWVDMRYARQLHDVRVPVGTLRDEAPAAKVRATFEELYERMYGQGAVMRNADVQFLTIGVDLNGQILQPALQKLPLGSPDPASAVWNHGRSTGPNSAIG